MTMKPEVNVWDELSRRFYGANRNFLKAVVLMSLYGGETDPWLDRMLRAELNQMMIEQGMTDGFRS